MLVVGMSGGVRVLRIWSWLVYVSASHVPSFVRIESVLVGLSVVEYANIFGLCGASLLRRI